MAVKKLTARQKKFAQAYLKTLNATQAAIEAGYGKGNPEQCAIRGYELVRNSKVKEYIDAELSKIAEYDKIDAKYVLKQLKIEAERIQFGSHSARVSALGILAKYLGMLVDKSELTINIKEVKVMVIQIQGVIAKHIPDAEVRNRIAEDLKELGL